MAWIGSLHRRCRCSSSGTSCWKFPNLRRTSEELQETGVDLSLTTKALLPTGTTRRSLIFESFQQALQAHIIELIVGGTLIGTQGRKSRRVNGTFCSGK